MFLYIKILHIVSVISWMAGLLYLPRLIVYHTENKDKAELTAVFQRMEYRLHCYIMIPAHILTYVSGLYLALEGGFLQDSWLHAKFLFVFFLSGYHLYLNYHRKQLVKNIYKHSSRYYRILNEVPTLLLIIIVTIVVLKP